MDPAMSHLVAGLAHMAPSTASYSSSMGRSVRSCLSKQNENRRDGQQGFPSQAGGTLSASLTATIWSRRLGWNLCLSSDDVLEVDQGLQAEMAMKFAARRLRTVGAEAGTGIHRSFRLPTLRCELGHRLSHPVDRAAPFRAAMLGSPWVHPQCIRCAG